MRADHEILKRFVRDAAQPHEHNRIRLIVRLDVLRGRIFFDQRVALFEVRQPDAE